MECRKEINLKNCNCSYESCSRKGLCCQCIAYHKDSGELPACYFDNNAEKTYNRSIGYFMKLNSR
ncbi:DUF6485 family protein [bacterium]|nr:DUF6485 family protein [bacterium]